MDKRFIIAIAMVFLILLLWPILFRSEKQPPATPKKDKPNEAQETQAVQQEESETVIPELEVIPQVSEETIIPVQMPLYDIEFTTEGARAISWRINDYFRRTKDSTEEPAPINLINLTSRKCLLVEFLDPEIQDEMEDAVWAADKEFIKESGLAQDSIQFTYSSSSGVDFSKKITFFPEDYFVDMDITFRNRLSEETKLGGYNLYWGAGLAKDEKIKGIELVKEGPIALVTTEKGQELIRHWHSSGIGCIGKKHTRIPEYGGPISWVGFGSKYFTAALIPDSDPWWTDTGNGEKRYIVTTELKDTVLPPTLPPADIWREWGQNTVIGLVRSEFSLAPGETSIHKYRIYVGPKKWDILRSIKGRSDTQESLGLGKMLNFGIFSPLGKGTLWLLNKSYNVTHNYGIGIIFLTILIKILYFPLTQRSFKSMNKMRDLQPKISELKEKHRDDPQRLQQETMKLYKKNKVNPMGGCLPLLFQLPVFWALFATLRGAVELRNAIFIPGWVTDLSQPDTIAMIGRFPINILPLLMTATMLLQQLLSPGGQGGQNNKMMAFMPLIFAFIFYNMPSGLVLYWLCNNILAIGHQYMIKRQESVAVEIKEDDKGKNKSQQ